MPDLTLLSRTARPLLTIAMLVGAGTSAAIAQDAPPPAATELPPAASADETDIVGSEQDSDRRWSRDYFSLAGGVVSAPDYNGSDEQRILPGLYARGRVGGYAFSTRGTSTQVDLIRDRRGQTTNLRFGPLLRFRAERTGSVDDPRVDALEDRDLAVELGLFAGISHTGVITSAYDQISFRLAGVRDVSGAHGSWSITPTIDYGTPLSRHIYVGVSASMNFYGRGFGRYYYNIDAEGSAASGLPIYTGGARSGMGEYTLGIGGAYSPSGDLRKGFVLIAGAQYSRMTNHLADSPIVEEAGDANQWLFGGGLAYQF